MTSAIPLKNPSWDLNKDLYAEIDELPMMSNPSAVFVVLATYLVFILKIGPDLMRKREAFKLTKTLLFYNAFQVILSAYLVLSISKILLLTGLVPKKCYMNDNNFRNEIVFNTWLYFVAKVTELVDTVMFVLRKKDNQVTFLHVYHHSIMMTGTWFTVKYWPSETLLYVGFINSLVHVFMYTYYGLAALGPQMSKYLTWKKYMTKFQLIQFVSILVQYFASLYVSECPPSGGVAVFILANVVVFLFLFANFYRKNYTKKSENRSPNANGTSSNGIAKTNGITSEDKVK